MWYPLRMFLEKLFPKYKLTEYYEHGTEKKRCWAILERRWLFFYKPLTHIKEVDRDYWVRAYYSHEILMFDSEEDAEGEIDRLDFGYPPIARRIYYNGELKKVEYEGVK